MSGPVVAIGFILLIPSILGILFSAFMFLGVNARTGDESAASTRESSRPVQSDFDANFRRSCAKSVKQKNQEVGYYASQQLIEQYCECALSAFKETASETTLEQPSQEVDAFYSGETSHRTPDGDGENLFRVLGSGFAVALGIASFVGGLLGWLLVMRKSVLQCNVCGAVINAS
jgi:hypothetical protein